MTKLLLIVFGIVAVLVIANQLVWAIAISLKFIIIVLAVGLLGYAFGRYSKSKS